jgi:hypothetical protein
MKANIVVGETYYNNHGEPIRFGEFIKLHFAGGPADAPEPWKLVKAANGTSSVNPKANWVALTIEDANGARHVFKPANIYSPVLGGAAADYDRVARQASRFGRARRAGRVKYPPGTRVKVAGGSGIDSDKSGAVIAWSDPKAKETLEGNRRLRDKGWIAVLFDDGSVSCQPESRLSAGGPKVEAKMDYERIAQQAGPAEPPERLPDGTRVHVRRQFEEECDGVVREGEYDGGWLYRIEVTGGDHLDAHREGADGGLWDKEGELWVCDFEVHPIGESGSGPREAARQRGLDLGPDAPFDRPVRREPREKGKGRGRWLALDTMDHIVGCVQRAQQRMSAGGVKDGAYLVRVAFEELRDLHAGLTGGELTDDAWDV